MSTKENEVEEFENEFGFSEGESFVEAEARKQEEEASKGFAKIPYFKPTGDKFSIRILPHAPKVKNAPKGYSQPIHSVWLPIEKADGKIANVKVVNAKDCGFDADIFSKYRFMVKDSLKEQMVDAKPKKSKKLEDLLKKYESGRYKNELGLRYDFKHLMWVFDAEDDKKTVQLYEAPNGTRNSIEEAKMSIWAKLAKKNPSQKCPISNPFKAFYTELTKGDKKYTVFIDNISGWDTLTKDVVDQLNKLPELSSFLSYNKRSFEATMVFLERFDEEHNLGIFNTEEFQAEVTKLKDAVYAVTDDKSSFSVESNGGSEDDVDGDGVEEGLTLDGLYDMFEALQDDDVEEGEDEMKAFRQKLRDYIKQEGLSVKVSRKKATKEALEEINDAIEELGGERGVTTKDEDVEPKKPSKETSSDTDDKDEDDEDDEADEVDDVEDDAPNSDSDKKDDDEDDEDDEDEVEESKPRRATRTRRGARNKR